MKTITDQQNQLHSFYLQNQQSLTAIPLDTDKNDSTIIAEDVCNSLVTAVASFEEHLQNFDFKEHLEINGKNNIFNFEENLFEKFKDLQNFQNVNSNIISMEKTQLEQPGSTKQIEKYDVTTSHQTRRARRPKASVSNFSCIKCNIQFQSASAYASHMQLHSMDRPFSCDICERRYPLKSIMERHKRNVHSSSVASKTLTSNFSCEFCRHKFHSLYEMDKHKTLCAFNTAVQQDYDPTEDNSQGI